VRRHTRSIAPLAAFAGFVLAVVAATPAIAHHSFAMYDQTKTQTLSGTLVRFIPGSSHSQFVFDLIGTDGKPVMGKNSQPVKWQVELGSAANIARQGVTVKTFPVGTVLTVTLHPQRDGRNQGAIAGPLVLCGTTLPAGGCTPETGKVMKPPAN
jgi:hypothetical protein